MTDPRLERLLSLIRNVPDFPKPGIQFKDISPLLGDAQGFAHVIDLLAEAIRPLRPECVAGPEARGFIFGAPLAVALGIGFAPIRKKGKLPWKTIEESYALEYGTDTLQMHADALKPNSRVVLVDDLLATGGTMAACRRLAEKTGARVVGAQFVIELSFLSGRTQLDGIPTGSLVTF